MGTPDMSTHLMLDDIYASTIESHDSPAWAVAGYVDGNVAWQDYPSLVAHYAGTSMHLLSITVFADNGANGAQCLDIENGDATIAQAPGWFAPTQAAGKAANDLRYYPKLYISASESQALIDVMSAAGIARDEYMLWSAHWTGVAHICSPGGCGYPAADATQYTDTFAGASIDGSMVYGYFFAGPPGSNPPPVPSYPAWQLPTSFDAGPINYPISWSVAPGGVAGTVAYHYQAVDSTGAVFADGRTNDQSVTLTIQRPGTFKWRLAVGADATHQASPWSQWFTDTV